MQYIYPFDLYRAAALNAFLNRGHDIDTAIQLADEVATKMERDEDFEDE